LAKPSQNPEWLRIQAQRGSRDQESNLRLRSPQDVSPHRAAFYIEVVIGSQGGTPTQRLKRAVPWNLSYTAPAGRYACFPAWDGGALIEAEPAVTVTRKLLEEVLEAFRTGVIQDDTARGLRVALDAEPSPVGEISPGSRADLLRAAAYLAAKNEADSTIDAAEADRISGVLRSLASRT
jgi:hypothetical protein